MDLTALDTFIEFKRRIGTTGGFNPDPQNVQQLGSDIRHLAETDTADLLHGRDFRNKTGYRARLPAKHRTSATIHNLNP